MTSFPDLQSLAAELIRRPSVNPMGRPDAAISSGPYGEQRLAEYLAGMLREHGGEVLFEEVKPGRPNVIAWFDFGAPETIILEAHLDTVPADGMTIDPFAGKIRDGRLWGRGACDVKGPMAAMLAAVFEARRASSSRARHNVVFAAVCDEEYSFAGVRHFAGCLRSLPLGPAPLAFAVVAEPTDLEPVMAHKGVVRWEASASGVAVHASVPERGKNAIYAMAPAISAMESHAFELRKRAPHPLLGAPSLSVGTIRGGSAVNVVPDFCSVQIDRRLVPGETPDGATEELRRVLAGCDVELSEAIMSAPAFEVAEEHPAVQLCLQAARAAGHTATRPRAADYCTNASYYSTCDLPAVVFGPGSIAPAHTRDEWISLDQLHAGARAYHHLICGQ